MRSASLLAISPWLLLAALSACEEDPPAAATTATATATAAATAKPQPTAAPETPKALDVEGLKKSLGCGDPGAGPCSVLAEFHDCIDWDPLTDSGDGRWLGRGSVVRKGEFIEEYSLLRTRRVPLDQVGPGQLGAKIGLASIPDDQLAAKREADRAVKAYATGDVPPANNSAVSYIKEREEWPEAFAMKAEDNQIHVADHGGMWLCARDDQRLGMVRLRGNREHKADGTYAILYPVTW